MSPDRQEGKTMGTLKNFVLGLLLAAVLIAPTAWAQPGDLVHAGLSAVAEQFGQPAHAVTISVSVSPALVRAR